MKKKRKADGDEEGAGAEEGHGAAGAAVQGEPHGRAVEEGVGLRLDAKYSSKKKSKEEKKTPEVRQEEERS